LFEETLSQKADVFYLIESDLFFILTIFPQSATVLPDEIVAELEELRQGKISAAEKRKKLRDRIKEVNAENFLELFVLLLT
jgi:hypothetical protein